ncbi:hypothetical protein AVEN_37545-1 [Araneus ventricosus]|uniref:Uncharacterized protein n=1 Tax=Araneus ventricosus TaxID=182803 RepID=A0A4Y2X5Y0_ARAVE|nr:hypothetical protein AVEN_37545-1 [Araneus ventricosus]
MGCHARPTRGGNLLSMRSKKQTEWQQLLMEWQQLLMEWQQLLMEWQQLLMEWQQLLIPSHAYPRGKESKSTNSRREKNGKRSDTRVPRGCEARHT